MSKSFIKKFWEFLHKDSWYSLIVTLILAVVIIRFLFFPLLSFITGTSLPLVIVESCSMYHYEEGFGKIIENGIYEDNGIYLEDTENWVFQNGFSKGDIIFVIGVKNVEVGDVIIFNAGAKYPLIHRVIRADEDYGTKGDNYITNPEQLPSEEEIQKEQIMGKALFKIPYIGWVKLILFEFGRPANERGFCSNLFYPETIS
jgi:signal peptidase I